MKHVTCLRWAGHFVPGALLFAAMAVFPAAADGIIQKDLKQTTLDQAEVRTNTAEVVTQVQGLIDELAANGISGDDAKVLQATRAALANLSGPEMDRVIASLQKAAAAGSPTDATANALHAYTAQKGIVLQFGMILKEYEERQALDALAERFKELTHRQTDTMHTTETVARQTGGRNFRELSTTEQTTQEIVQADQEAIGNEAGLAQDQLNQAAANGSGDDAKPLRQAREDMKAGQMQAVLSQAGDELKAGHLLKALNEQTAARDVLRRIALDLSPPANDAEKIAQTSEDLAKLIEEQKALLGQTHSAIDTKNLIAGLNDRQGDLVDEATLVQKDALVLSAPAAGLVQDAINPPMQTSRFQLGDLNGLPAAASAQEVAIAKLEEAQKLLQQELVDAENKEKAAEIAQANEPPPDPSALTTAAGNLDQAQTNVGNALAESNPPTGAPSPSNPSPNNNSPVNNPSPHDTTPGAPPDMTQALKDLTAAETNVNNVADTPGLPNSTQAAVTEAETDIAQGKQDAAHGDAPGTMAQAGAAQTALTRAQATLALAMAGMSGVPSPAEPPLPMPPGPDQRSLRGAQMVIGGGNQPGHLHGVTDNTVKIIGLQNRIRVALEVSGTEKRPQEYAPLIDQYLKNLADESSAQ